MCDGDREARKSERKWYVITGNRIRVPREFLSRELGEEIGRSMDSSPPREEVFVNYQTLKKNFHRKEPCQSLALLDTGRGILVTQPDHPSQQIGPFTAVLLPRHHSGRSDRARCSQPRLRNLSWWTLNKVYFSGRPHSEMKSSKLISS